MTGNKINVFFYGLFMDESLLASKGIQSKGSRQGYVKGFRLHIGERATLLPDQNSCSFGVLMELDETDVAALYSDQSVSDYVAEPVIAHLANGMQVAGVCYNLPASKLKGTNPKYATALLKVATGLDMPDDYLAHIRSIADLS